MIEAFIGLMSGTSLDGIDGVLVEFGIPGAPPAARVVAHAHRAFPAPLRAELAALNGAGANELHRAALAANALAVESTAVVEALLVKARCERNRVVAIGSFQSLQHRASDMFVAAEQARSMSMFATMANDFENARERTNAVAAAKVQIGKSLKFVGQQSIQLHGGIGMTMEAKIGHYFKRLTMIENSFGDTDYHQRRVADAGGLI